MRAGPSGGVCAGLDEPYSATSGRPSAAATCINPESFETTASASDSRSTAAPRSVRPQRLSAVPFDPRTISSPIARSAPRADQPDVAPARGERARKLGEMTRRPTFRRPVFGARAERHHGTRVVEPEPGDRDREIRLVHVEPDGSERPARRFAGCFGELCIALRHQRKRRLVEPVQDVEKPVTRFADEPDAPRNPREERDQRRLEAARQNDRRVVAPPRERAREPPAGAELQARRARAASR